MVSLIILLFNILSRFRTEIGRTKIQLFCHTDKRKLHPGRKRSAKSVPNHPPPTARRLLNCRYQLGLFFVCSSVVLRSPWLAPAANRLWLNSINQLSSCSPAAPRDLVDLVNYSAFGGYAKRKIYEIYRFPPAGLGVCHFIYMAQLGLKRFVRSGEIITLSPFFIIGKPNCFRLQRYELFSTWKPFFEKKISCLQTQKKGGAWLRLPK